MEGQLCKWTNYWNGWQSRWFILDEGILSYYKSFDEVEQGCKGSVNVSACEIAIHATDPTRLDLTIPGEQHLYLKAKHEKERQEWLIALGSSKACLSNRKSSVISKAAQGCSGISPPKSSSDPSSSEDLRIKRSELRLYCDMLMQQVHGVKQAVQQKQVDVEKLEEGSCLLSQTCDTFISTLDELMTLTDANLAKTAINPVQNGISRIHNRASKSNSLERSIPPMTTLANHRQRRQLHETQKRSTSSEGHDGFQALFGESSIAEQSDVEESPRKTNGVQKEKKIEPEDSQDLLPMLPFGKVAFPDLLPDKSIPTLQFLNASSGVITLFDLFERRAFSPIKMDLHGHIECLRTKLASDSTTFHSLNSIVSSELTSRMAKNPHSACSALLWLVRSLMFVHNFLRKVTISLLENADDDAVKKCLSEAYEETLREYHGVVIRNVFGVAMQSCPSRASFLTSLGLSSSDESAFQAKIVPKMAPFLDQMETCLMEANMVLKRANLEKE